MFVFYPRCIQLYASLCDATWYVIGQQTLQLNASSTWEPARDCGPYTLQFQSTSNAPHD